MLPPAARFSLRTFGGFALEHGARPCDLAYEKGRALLAYLAVEPGRSYSRTFLAGMFWPDLEREAGLTNLRQVLHNLRQVLDVEGSSGSPLLTGRESIQLDPSASLEIDALSFMTPLKACLVVPPQDQCVICLAKMEALAASYRGEFMAGFSLPDCPDFEEWLQAQREILHLHILLVLARLSDCHERSGDYLKSLPFARRFHGLEPWNEEGLRRVMRLLALSGQRAAALAAYEACCQTLKRELGILPSEETIVLEESIRKDEIFPDVHGARNLVSFDSAQQFVTERRQVTVLCCELMSCGETDMDKVLGQLSAPQAHCKEIINGFSGYLVSIHGGSLLAYFGFPKARENAARQAVRAALAVISTKFAGVGLRVGIHTGMVISGGEPQVPDAIGAISARAISLHQLVGPGEVVISEATRRLIAGYFKCLSLGVKTFPDDQNGMEVFRVGSQSDAKDRLDAASSLSPFVGRKKELATLRKLWKEACRGVPQVVLLRGDAGIGKSRLVMALKDSIPEKTAVTRVLRCYPEHSLSPFFPLIALFESVLDFAPDDLPEANFNKLAIYVKKNYTHVDRDTVPLLARMLALPIQKSYPEPSGSPLQQRSKTLKILLDRLNSLADQKPVLLIVEDIHWIDPSTLEVLMSFVNQEKKAPILAVFTARPDFLPVWKTSAVETIPLVALDYDQTAALITAVAPNIEPSTIPTIVERSDGIPLFAEELAKEVDANDQSEIPSSLRDLLVTRLDGMGAAKFLAQSAATLGRKFSIELLRKISRHDEATLSQLLDQLEISGIVQSLNDNFYQFRHALIRDAAYQSQTRSERESVHRLIATILKSSGSQVRPEFVAHHLAAGGQIRESLEKWIEAGKLANRESACQESVMHFKSGLAQIGLLPSGQDRVGIELELHFGLGTAACAVQGYASSEGLDAYKRAMALCSQHENNPSMFRAIWGLWASASSRVGYAGARDLAIKLMRIATRNGNPVQGQQAHFAIADTLYWQGEFVVAREHLERVKTLYLVEHHKTHIAEFGEDAGVTSSAYASWVLWFLGYPDQARRASAQSLELARRLGHPFSLAYALTFAAILHCRLRQPVEAINLADETLSLASTHGFPLWQIGGMLSRAWALVMQKNRDGIESLQNCVEATRIAMGGVTLVVLEPLVDACVSLDLFNEAIGLNNEAMVAGLAIGDRHVEAELLRLKGESLLGLSESGVAEAEICFNQALVISRKQQAKSLELRAAISLARLWKEQGKQYDAGQLLEGIYSWFSEGFDTPDLQNARRLLDSLAK